MPCGAPKQLDAPPGPPFAAEHELSLPQVAHLFVVGEQRSVTQSKNAVQLFPTAQGAQFGLDPPQSTSVSVPSFTLSSHVHSPNPSHVSFPGHSPAGS
jgi:hypothetical protein